MPLRGESSRAARKSWWKGVGDEGQVMMNYRLGVEMICGSWEGKVAWGANGVVIDKNKRGDW